MLSNIPDYAYMIAGAVVLILIIILIIFLTRRKYVTKVVLKNRMYIKVDPLKTYTLQDFQKIYVFKHNQLIEIVDSKVFSLSEYAKAHDSAINYHAYLVNLLPINDSFSVEARQDYYDSVYKVFLKFNVKGTLTFEVADVHKFIENLSEFKEVFYFNDLKSKLCNVNVPKYNLFSLALENSINDFCTKEQVSFTALDFHLDQLDVKIKTDLNEKLAKFGLVISELHTFDVNILDSNEVNTLQSIFLKAQEFDILKYSLSDEIRANYFRKKYNVAEYNDIVNKVFIEKEMMNTQLPQVSSKEDVVVVKDKKSKRKKNKKRKKVKK